MSQIEPNCFNLERNLRADENFVEGGVENTPMDKSNDTVKKTSSLIEKHQSIQIVFAIFLVGFFFRLFLLKFRYVVAFDEVNYLKLGVSGYLEGMYAVFHPYWSPLLPSLISFSCHIFSSYEFAARFISVLSGALLIFPTFQVAKRIYSEKAALFAAAFVEFYPPLAFQSTRIYTESLFMLVGTIVLLFGLKWLETNEMKWLFIIGSGSGLLYLLHPLGVGFLIVMLGWVVLGKIVNWQTSSVPRMMGRVFVLCFSFVMVASPYLMYLKKQTGVWTLSAKAAANQQFEAYEKGDEDTDTDTDPFLALDKKNETVPFDQIYHQGDFLQRTQDSPRQISTVKLGSFLARYFKNVYIMLKTTIPTMLTTILMILLSLGLFGDGPQRTRGKKIGFLLSFIGFYWFLVIPAFHITERYLTPLWPVCAIFVANGFWVFTKWLYNSSSIEKVSEKFHFRTMTVSNIFVGVLVFTLSFLPEFGKIVSRNPFSPDYWTPPMEQRIAGEWLKKHTDGPPVLMSRYQSVDIYAGNYDIHQSITIPDNAIERVVAYARNRGVQFIVLNERYKKDNPKITYLYESDIAPLGLKQIYAKRDASGYLTKIYQVL